MNGKKPFDLDSQAAFKGQNQSVQQGVPPSPKIIKQGTPMNASADFVSTRSEPNGVTGKPQQTQQLKNTLSSMLLERRNLMDSMRTNKGAGEAQQELKIQLQILNNNIETVQEKIQFLEK